jgi:hypothetical protein
VGDFSNGLAPVYKLIHTGPPAEEYKLLGYIDAKGTQYWENSPMLSMYGYNAQHTSQCPYDTSKK